MKNQTTLGESRSESESKSENHEIVFPSLADIGLTDPIQRIKSILLKRKAAIRKQMNLMDTLGVLQHQIREIERKTMDLKKTEKELQGKIMDTSQIEEQQLRALQPFLPLLIKKVREDLKQNNLINDNGA